MISERVLANKERSFENMKIKGSFILEFPFEQGNFSKISYRFLNNKMLLYFYSGEKEVEFDSKKFRFTEYTNGMRIKDKIRETITYKNYNTENKPDIQEFKLEEEVVG